MMRLTFATLVAILVSTPSWSQQSLPAQANQVQPNQIQASPTPDARVAAQGKQPVAPAQPFPPLNANAHAQLQEVLAKWEAQSKGMKTLECKFARWHFDMFAAPVGVHATRADGVIKYAAPDKGLFKVERLVFFNGMKDNKPQYQEQPGQHGEHWVCNGKQLIEFDQGKEECRIQDLPKNMQGEKIFNSPLPFVFNLDAKQIQQKYWVRQVAPPKPGVVLVEAWPKEQQNRAQYKLVQIALDEKTYLPSALIMYAPNFHPQKAPKWDHYEFSDVKRNAITAGFSKFLGNFIPEKPPGHWKILRNQFNPGGTAPVQPAAKQAEAATGHIQG
ncbi:MAG: TIGR03009 domain-containing protein [Rubripirellula sp.]